MLDEMNKFPYIDSKNVPIFVIMVDNISTDRSPDNPRDIVFFTNELHKLVFQGQVYQEYIFMVFSMGDRIYNIKVSSRVESILTATKLTNIYNQVKTNF